MTTKEENRVFHSMGIPVHITFVGISKEEADKYTERAEKVFRAYDEKFSRFKETSELHRLNTNKGNWCKVSIDLFQVLKKCVTLARETDGVFDPSVGGILASYGYGLPKDFSLPSPLPTYRTIEFDDRELSIRLAEGQILEPASIVKGLAIDKAGEEIVGVPGFMINAGGDILTRGPFKNGTLWNIAIQDPRDPRAIVSIISARDTSVATSGIYQTHGEKDGKKWHHLIDMKKGEASYESGDIVSATVIAPTCEQADTEASLAILLGIDQAIPRLKRLNLPYFLILDDGRIVKDAKFTTLELPLNKVEIM
ncbi:MAG: FAD:protein FMN transferase [Candidatus Yonathbacteria bacterium]|nr:FAD:protein FMN transferase [Candidatus Yonathbacteria bacterium]